MAKPSVTVDRLESFEVSLDLAPQVTFDEQSARSDSLNNLVQLFGTEVLCTDFRIDIGLLENLLRCARADAVNVRERRFNSLVARNVYSKESGHMLVLD